MDLGEKKLGIKKNQHLQFSTILKYTDPLVRDHRVHNIRILPGVTWLDLIYRFLNLKDFDLSKVVLKRVLFKEPIALTELYNARIQVYFHHKQDHWEITAKSCKRYPNKEQDTSPSGELHDKNNGAWTDNLSAELHLEPPPPPQKLDFAKLKRLSRRSSDMDYVYALARKSNILHDAFMKGLGQVYEGDGYLLAQIHLSQMAQTYLDYFYFHPAFLDSALLVPFFLSKDSGEKPFIPIYVESFRIYQKITDQSLVYIPTSKEIQTSNDVSYRDIELYTQEGLPAASYKRVATKRVRTEQSIEKLILGDVPQHVSTGDVKRHPVAEKSTAKEKDSEAPNWHQTLVNQLRSMVAEKKGDSFSEVGLDIGFYDLGLDSQDLLTIVQSLENLMGVQLYPTLLFEYATIRELAAFLSSEYGQPSENAKCLNEAQTSVEESMLYYQTAWSQVHDIPHRYLHAPAGSFLLFDNGEKIYQALRHRLGEEALVWVKAGAVFKNTGPLMFELNLADKHNYIKLMDALSLQNVLPQNVIHSLSKTAFATDRESVQKSMADSLDTILYAIQAMMQKKIKTPLKWLYMFQTSAEFGHPVYEAVCALCKTISLESPKFQFTILECLGTASEAYPLADMIFHELQTIGPQVDHIRYDGQNRYQKRIKPLPVQKTKSSSSPNDETLWFPKQNGTYLITGGLGEIGYIFGQYLASTCSPVNMVLVGRSALKQQGQQRLSRLKELGANVIYVQADISDPEHVRTLIERSYNRFQEISGVIHSAGAIRDALIVKKEKADIDAVLAAKLFGTIYLDDALKDKNLDFFVLFSSLTGVIGNVGQSDYAYGNHFLNAFAAFREDLRKKGERKGKTLSISWPLWKHGGMDIDSQNLAWMKTNLGFSPISDQEGLDAFEVGLRSQVANLIFVKGMPEKIEKALSAKLEDQYDDLAPEINTTGIDRSAMAEAASFNSEQLLISDDPVASAKHDSAPTPVNESAPLRDIAIIGLSGRYPQANTLDEFWDNLTQGRDCIVEVPEDRRQLWRNIPGYEKNALHKTEKNIWGGFIDGADQFDPLFFNISPRAAETMDPQERLFLQTSWEVIEDAGYRVSQLSGAHIGVYVGVMWGQYQLLRGMENDSPVIPDSFYASLANRISYTFNFNGPSIALDTMCSSSLTALYLACNSIQNGECTMAIAGGVNLSIHPDKYIYLDQRKMMAREGRCRSFGKGADGYVPGEGVGAVFLKPLQAAINDDDHIYGVIKGISINHGGKSGGYTVPNPKAQTNLIIDAFKKADIDPRTISYVEAHGTGTALGDPIEIAGLTKAFAHFTQDRQFCSLGSVKSNIGHLEGAAGISAITKVLLQMKHKKLVPSLHSASLNPMLKFEATPFYVQQELNDWKRPVVDHDGREDVYPLRAGVSAFGAGGTNVHIVLEAYDNKEVRSDAGSAFNGPQLFVLSSKNEEQLKTYAQKMADYLKVANGCHVTLSNVTYTSQVGREAMEERIAVIVTSIKDLKVKLRRFVEGEDDIDDLYRGHVTRTKNALDVFAADDDLQKAIDAWISKGKFGKLLDLWVKGLDFDWNKLYGKIKPRRISLPTFPFEKERYWIPASVGNEQISSSNGYLARLHPLVDINESTLEEEVFRKTLKADEFFLKDHLVNNQNVLPGVAYLEMAKTAGEHAGKRPVRFIKDVIWGQPIILKANAQDVHIRITPENEKIIYDVFSNVDGQAISYSQGTIVYAMSGDQEDTSLQFDIDDIKKRCSLFHIKHNEIYERLKLIGFDYGPGFQVTQEVYSGQKEALVGLRLPHQLENSFLDYGLHPTLMDGAVRSALWIGRSDAMQSDITRVPFSMESLEIIRPLQEKCYAYASLASENGDSQYPKVDITILDASGKELIRIKKLTSRPVRTSNLLYYQRKWDKTPLHADEKQIRLTASETILLFDDRENAADEIRSFISGFSDPGKVIQVKPAKAYKVEDSQHYRIDPKNPEHYKRLFQDLQTSKTFPSTIFHLWNFNFRTPDRPYSSPDISIEQQTNQALDSGLFSILYLFQAAAGINTETKTRCLFVFNQSPGHISNLHEAVSGFARSLTTVDHLFELLSIQFDSSEADLTFLARVLIEEASLDGDLNAAEICYKNRIRFVRNNHRFEDRGEKTDKKKNIAMKRNGVYLITGGAGGLGMIFAQYLAKNYHAKLLLCGRSELNEEKHQKIHALESAGAEVVYLKADVGEIKDVDRMITVCKERFHDLNGIIHSAGITGDRSIIETDKSNFEKVLSAKIMGTINLDIATQNENLDFFVLFSSIASVVGDFGVGAYASGSQFMDSFAAQRGKWCLDKQRTGKTVSVNWPFWDKGGLTLPDAQNEASLYFKYSGMKALETKSGIKAFEAIMQQDLSQLIVVTGDSKKIDRVLRIRRPAREQNIPAPTTSRLTRRLTPSLKSAAAPQKPESASIKGALFTKTQHYLKKIFSQMIKLPVHRIDPHRELEEYGINSIMIMELNKIFQKDFESLPGTLFFEHNNLHDLSDYFIKNHTSRLKEIFAIKEKDTHPDEPVKTHIHQDPRPSRFKNLQLNPTAARYQTTEEIANKDIAIIGLSGKYPMAENLDEFWENLSAGKDCITEIPEERWDYRQYFDADNHKEGSVYSKWGGFISDVDKFDPLFFKISPAEAAYMDPNERLFLSAVWQAIEDAGYTRKGLSNTFKQPAQKKVGVFAGVMWGHYMLLGGDSTYSSIANRVSYVFNFNGPSMTIDTACSSSLVCIHNACESIRSGECNYAVAGGVNISIHPDKYKTLCQMKMLSSDGRCRSFGQGGDGYVPGEGVGAILLKPLHRAVSDGDHIYAVIKGSAVNHGGKTNGYTVPNPDAHTDLICSTLEKSGIDPRTISYIEAHGTGTTLGDPIEIRGLNNSFKKYTTDLQFCSIGSVKSNIGHLEGAAGISAITKVLLQIKHKQLVPSLHSASLNPMLKFKATPFYVQQELNDWKRPVIGREGRDEVYPRRAGISAFGAGGTNAHIILEEYDSKKVTSDKLLRSNAPQVFVLSAKNEERLKVYAKKMADYLDKIDLRMAPDNVNQNQLIESLLNDLSKAVCEIVKVNEEDIDLNTDLIEYGFEPVNMAGLCDWISENYKIELNLSIFTKYSSIDSLAHHLNDTYTENIIQRYFERTQDESPDVKPDVKPDAKPDAKPIEKMPSDDYLSSITYTSQVGREAMDERFAVIVNSVKELAAKLQSFVKGEDDIDGCYRGQVKANQETLAVFSADADMAELIDTWIAKGKIDKLLELWVKGLEVDWRKMYEGSVPNRISLPTYPFEKERYWIPDSVDTIKTADFSEQRFSSTFTGQENNQRVDKSLNDLSYYSKEPKEIGSQEQIMTFKEVCQEASLPDMASVDVKHLICFLSNPAHQQAMVEKMQTLNKQTQIIFISQGTIYQKKSKQYYSVSQSDKSTYENAFKNIIEDYGTADAVVYLWALEDRGCIEDYSPIVYILQGFSAVNLNPGRFLLSGWFKDGLDRCYLESWIGFERSLGLVIPGTQVASVYYDATEPNNIIAMDNWMQILWQELRVPKLESVIYQDNKRYVYKIQPTVMQPGRNLLKPNGTYLITGGCGGLGYLFAKHLAKTQNANLILCGRSQADNEKLSELKKLGGQVAYIEADVCDKMRMKNGIDHAKKRFGKIQGVIHAAGIQGIQNILVKEIEDFNNILAPKIKGTLVLSELLYNENLDFTCYFSSSAAILGDFGSCDYAIANRFQMAYAQYGNQKNGRTIAISWPLWREGGMRVGENEQTKMYLKSSGQRFLEQEEGVLQFENLLKQDESHHLIMAGQKQRVHRILGLNSDPHSDNASDSIAESVNAEREQRPEMKGLTLAQCVSWDLKEHTSKLLQIPRNKIDLRDNLADFGFDSISLGKFAALLNQYYEIEITPDLFFGYPTLGKLTNYFLKEYHKNIQAFYQKELEPRISQSETLVTKNAKKSKRPRLETVNLQKSNAEPIAIIGMSGRFPKAESIEEMWNILIKGQDAVEEIPEDRFDIRRYFGEPNQGKTNCKWSGLIPGVDEFDPLFFEISPLEAETMDPRQRHLLQESWKALEDAGYGKKQISQNRIGMFVGVEQSDYSVRGGTTLTSNHSAILAARISYFLNLDGPNMAINTACSSGLVSVHQACLSLRNNECDTAIAAGVNLMLAPHRYIGMSQAGMLSKDGKCFTFDKRANGMVPGEAAAVLVLKRLSHAIADNDSIYALVKGSGINYDGKTNGITSPSLVSQTKLLRSVYDQYQVNPEEIEYIVSHGTGTKLGDSIEINALYDAFKNYTMKKNYCALTSCKTNFGHTFAASGIVSMINLVQAFCHGKIPASLNCEQENDYINWKDSPFYINKKNKSWPVENGKVRTGAVSSFGMSGTNAHVVLQSYNGLEPAPDYFPYYLLALSAKTKDALQQKTEDLISYFQNKDIQNKSLTNISYTLLEGRQHFQYRCAIVIQDPADAVYVLQQVRKKEKLPNLFFGTVPRDFEGQKAIQEYADDLLQQIESFRETKDRYKEILHALAAFYCQGYELPWQKLYNENPPRRIRLPSYPFAKEHYWINNSSDPVPISNVSEFSKTLHPLMHVNTSNLSQQRFSSTFTGDEFFLADHVVKGQHILPGVAYLEMARAAIDHSVAALEEEREIRLKNIVWIRPITVDTQTTTVHIRLFSEANEEISFEIFSNQEVADSEEIVHCQGVALLGSASKAPPVSIASLRSECCTREVSSDPIYKLFNKIGMEYGPTHQGIETVYVGPDKVLAKLILPSSVSDTIDQYLLHPSLMDSALQATVCLLTGDIDETKPFNPALPFALDELEVYSKCTSPMWAFIRYSDGCNSEGKIQKTDVDLCDDKGNVCIRLKGFTSRIPEGELAPEAEAEIKTLMFSKMWKEQPALAVKPENKTVQKTIVSKYQEHLVIICEPDEGTQKSSNTTNDGINCLTLKSTPIEIEKRFQQYAVKTFTKIQSILKDQPKGKVLIQVVVPRTGERNLFSGLFGMLKTASLENPQLVGQLIEIENSANVTEIINENVFYPGESHIKYQAGKRYVANWQEVKFSKENHEIPWKNNGVYLIAGGAGGLGLIVAKEIVSKVKGATLILIGRSKNAEAIQKEFLKIEKMNDVRIVYKQVDITRKQDISDLIQNILNDYKNLNGIIHSAGIIRDNFIIKKTTEELLDVLGPKVNGLVNLDNASKDLSLDFFVLFSSLTGVFGNPGQADYACANAFMDAFAWHRNTLLESKQRQGKTLSINWPLWQEGGMNTDKETEKIMMQNTGMVPLQIHTGFLTLYQGLVSDQAQLLVMEGNPIKMKQLFLSDDLSGLSSGLSSGALPQDHTSDKKVPNIAQDLLVAKAENYLIKLISSVIKLPVNRIEADAPLEKYGIDSIMVTQMTNQLEKSFGSLPKTLFFEYINIKALTEYFIESHYKKIIELLNITEAATDMNVSDGMTDSVKIPKKSRNSRSFESIEIRESENDKKIAIVGLSGRYPHAKNIQEFWENLRDGRDCITEIPRDRWDHGLYFDEDKYKPGKTYSKWGGFIDDVDKFDPLFFNISPREALIMDPQERLFLECVYETIEDAGYTRESISKKQDFGLSGNVGIYVGVMYEEYQLYGAQEQILGRPVTMPGNPSSIANRVSYFCNFHGPSIAIDTMCSSSLTAIHLACQSLKRDECQVAIAGGVNVSIHPNKYLLLGQGQFVSSKGRCESFGQGGDGYVPGEGVGAVLLKPLASAIADKDHIYGIIKSTAINHGGKTNGYSVPNPNAQASVMGRAFKEAGINPRTLSYFEAHGTGTALGDPIEITGLNKAFREYTKDTQFCAIGSVKSNIGHCESASGIAGVTKVLLQLEHKKLVPSLHSKVLNPNIDFKDSPFIVQQELAEWNRPNVEINGKSIEYQRLAGISSFGAGGANAHVVIEEYNNSSVNERTLAFDSNEPKIFVLSAKSEKQLKIYAENIVGFLTNTASRKLNNKINLTNLAYTSQVGREAMEERMGVIVNSLEELQEKLSCFIEDKEGIDDLFRGKVKHHKDTLTVFSADDELQEAVDKWIQLKKYTKLVDFWVKGLNFDWNKLYGETQPYRIGFPTYPFVKVRYWLPDVSSGYQGQSVREGVMSKNRSSAHQHSSALYEGLSEEHLIAISDDSKFAATEIIKNGQTLNVRDQIIPDALNKPEGIILQPLSADHIQVKREHPLPLKAITLSNIDDWAPFPSIDFENTSVTHLQAKDSVLSDDYRVEKEQRSVEPIKPVGQPSAVILLKKLQQELKSSLAEALFMDESDIDLDKQFVDLGMDSIVGVEWIRAINKQYDISLAATKLYDYPNINELSGFLEKELNKQGKHAVQTPLKSQPFHSIDEILLQVKLGTLNIEQADQLLKEISV